jgi:hypothetical protein
MGTIPVLAPNMVVAKESAPSKKRGLSLEEKRKRLCEYFLEKVDITLNTGTFNLLLVPFVERLFPIERARKARAQSDRHCQPNRQGRLAEFG